MKSLFSYAQCLKNAGLLVAMPQNDCQIEYVSYSSQNVKPNTLFICKGKGFKQEYLENAIKDGACAYISEKKYEADVPCILVNNALFAMSAVSAFFYDYPQNDLILLGITGTKGKSTTSCYLKAILDDYLNEINEPPSTLISSILTDDGVECFESHITTPEGLDLHRHLRNSVDSGRKYCILECSSQALKYGRVFGLTFDGGIFLNISEDHISPLEHQDFEDYFRSKLEIFKQSKLSFYNSMSDRVEDVKTAVKSSDCFSFGLENHSDFYGYDIKNKDFGLDFTVKSKDFTEDFHLGMPGKFNIENALAAISLCYNLGIPLKNIKNGLKNIHVDGRMEVFKSADKNKIIIVDYAHNLLSMTKLYETVKEEYSGREITTVFGCPGGKALSRRRDLGMVCGINSDRIYLTEDLCDFEKVRDISMEIGEYAERNCDNVFYVDDRTEAIRRAIFESSDNAIILLAAKGRETAQKRNGVYIPIVCDADLAEAFLALYDKLHSSPVKIR